MAEKKKLRKQEKKERKQQTASATDSGEASNTNGMSIYLIDFFVNYGI